MKWGNLCLVGLLAFPVYSIASESQMKFVAKKKVDGNRMFLYRCLNTGNIFEVEQHYNVHRGREEVRFIVNGLKGEWITEGLDSDVWNQHVGSSCKQSLNRYVSTTSH